MAVHLNEDEVVVEAIPPAAVERSSNPCAVFVDEINRTAVFFVSGDLEPIQSTLNVYSTKSEGVKDLVDPYA